MHINRHIFRYIGTVYSNGKKQRLYETKNIYDLSLQRIYTTYLNIFLTTDYLKLNTSITHKFLRLKSL